jgi:hypothetical protein
VKRQLAALVGLIFGLVYVQLAHAAPTPTALAEVNYLLAYVGKSGCEFYRNGTWYDSRAADGHLRYKFAVLAAHDQIETAEDFIEKAATKSSLSGRAYKVRCTGSAELKSSQWLREALTRYRLNGAYDATGVPSARQPTFGGA